MTITPITRSEVITRAQTVWGGLEKVPYSQARLVNGLWRADCSGYAGASANVPPGEGGSWGGPNTVSLETLGLVEEIHPSKLQPGDLIGNLGAGTAGDSGHVQVFAGWLNTDPDDNGHYVYEQTGPSGSPGPHHRLYRAWNSRYKAWRFKHVTDDVPAAHLSPAPEPERLAEDGELGPKTITRWQQVMGTPVDGVISHPSILVRTVQTHLNHKLGGADLRVDGEGINQDGHYYHTVEALQRYLGTTRDGVLSTPRSQCVEALQRRLNAGWF